MTLLHAIILAALRRPTIQVVGVASDEPLLANAAARSLIIIEKEVK